MIEHFSKWLEFVPLPYHSNERITYAFLDMVFNRFGAQAEILFDKGIELHGKFHELCEKALINHHTSRNHPEADGLIEPNFLLFGCEPKLLTSIRQDVMAIINMDDPNVWI
ncbi:hypothetical protein BDL97_02G065400 [Sphagnum fallax]|nr:hypothetical protein BDL97_02G065400 [Sphagnum fallax]